MTDMDRFAGAFERRVGDLMSKVVADYAERHPEALRNCKRSYKALTGQDAKTVLLWNIETKRFDKVKW